MKGGAPQGKSVFGGRTETPSVFVWGKGSYNQCWGKG